MAIWRWLTKKQPLNDYRDVLARIGFRCVWCTLPYFVVALAVAAFGQTKPLLTPASVVMLVVPIAGGVLDWWRIHRKSGRPVAV